MRPDFKKGFTLIEIMMAIGLIGILVSILIPNMLRSRMYANENATQATLRSFASACENYASYYGGFYPSTCGNLTSPRPPFFGYDIDDKTIDGYIFNVEFGGNNYTVTATPSPMQGRYDYRAVSGMVFTTCPKGTDNWEPL